MQDIIQLAVEYAPFAICCTVVMILLFAVCGNLLMKRRYPLWWILLTSIYIGLLFAGTLRIDSFRDLFEWHGSSAGDISYQLSFSAHDLYNVALFVPWGVLGMLRARKLSTPVVCLASGIMASFFIEVFQLYHMRSFDWGDIMTNSAGCALGVLLMLPAMLARMRCRKKRKMSAKAR